MSVILSEIFDLFARFGVDRYGEELSIAQHMLQSAAIAESLGAAPPVVTAALLHDIGYFVYSAGGSGDAPHETLGAVWLARGFDADVTAPIALHVQAKRYLCAVEPDYFEALSTASRISLAGQGGVMSPGEVTAFAQEPAFEAAVLLRRCDDRGKDVSLQTQNIAHYRDLMAACLRPTAP